MRKVLCPVHLQRVNNATCKFSCEYTGCAHNKNEEAKERMSLDQEIREGSEPKK